MNFLLRSKSVLGESMNSIFDKCCTAIITDVCDRMKMDYSIILDLKTRHKQAKMYGNARTMALSEEKGVDPNLDLGLDLIQDLNKDDILFVNGSNKFAYFGELLGLYCDKNNISGVIVNGRTRDSFSFENYSYPVFCRGYSPIDIVGRGKVKEIDCAIQISEGKINSGDFIFCDWEGCVILSQSNIASVLSEIKLEIEKENKIKSLILKGQELKSISKKIKYI